MSDAHDGQTPGLNVCLAISQALDCSLSSLLGQDTNGIDEHSKNERESESPSPKAQPITTREDRISNEIDFVLKIIRDRSILLDVNSQNYELCFRDFITDDATAFIKRYIEMSDFSICEDSLDLVRKEIIEKFVNVAIRKDEESRTEVCGNVTLIFGDDKDEDD